jgi:hypothetical protein
MLLHLFQNILCYVRSPVAPGLTSPWALRSRVLQASEYFWSHPLVLLKLHLGGVFQVFSWLLRGCKVLMPRVIVSLLLYGVRWKSHFVWISPRALGWIEESGWGSNKSWIFFSYLPKNLKISHWWHVSRSPRALNLNPKKIWKKGSQWTWHTLRCMFYICDDGKNRKN